MNATPPGWAENSASHGVATSGPDGRRHPSVVLSMTLSATLRSWSEPLCDPDTAHKAEDPGTRLGDHPRPAAATPVSRHCPIGSSQNR